MNSSNPRQVSGDRIYISPEGIAYEKIFHHNGRVVLKALGGDVLRMVDSKTFLNEWRCG